MSPSQLIDDFTKNHRYGSLEFEFRAGELTFVRKKETLIPASASYEKNSMVAPRGEHGVNYRDTDKTY
jgi:hypothetical protein